jgi:TrmH family RNA methyltransferase
MITSRQNSIIKKFRKVENEYFMVEGMKLIKEALNADFHLVELLFTEKSQPTDLDGTVITEQLSEYISDTESPQGIFALFKRFKRHKSPDSRQLDYSKQSRLCLLDGVQDPGNVGAIIRSCEAFGFDGIVMSESCVDIFNAKVIRSSAGSAFRLPCVRGDLLEIIPTLEHTIYAAALDESAVSLREINKNEKISVIIGNEGNGVSKSVLELCDCKLYIPIKNAESLNASVAASIICYELSQG